MLDLQSLCNDNNMFILFKLFYYLFSYQYYKYYRYNLTKPCTSKFMYDKYFLKHNCWSTDDCFCFPISLWYHMIYLWLKLVAHWYYILYTHPVYIYPSVLILVFGSVFLSFVSVNVFKPARTKCINPVPPACLGTLRPWHERLIIIDRDNL